MASEMNEESERQRKQSVKDYASKLFKESSVSAVSAIVSTGNIRRKIFRVVVFLLFTAGFLYQCIKFLGYVLQFPTIVNIEMDRSEHYLGPAYTFCNFNPIKRSKFCSKYPDGCFEPDEEFCEAHPKLCIENNTKIPKDDISEYLNGPKDIMELIHDYKELIIYSPTKEIPEGPFPRLDLDGYNAAACYSIFGRVNNSLEPKYRRKSMWKRSIDFMQFYPRENDILHPNSKPGILFAIHSPFEAVNPFMKGIFLKPGHLYLISVEMIEEELLPYPYKTDCLNYTELWLRANKTGPRSQEMCRHRCLLEYTENCFNCTDLIVLYPSHSKNICELYKRQPNVTEEICKDIHRYIRPCFDSCKEDCTRMKYSYQVQELISKCYNEKFHDKSNKTRFIEVYVQFEESEVMKLQYKPQYQQVEAFSYIGGFIGIWLGVSLVQVVDVIESFFLIARYFFKKGSIACLRKSSPEIRKETV
ncbi:unnamed protein product [Larinioides sclopetarius]|uniref:Uncharacterized protein n=1 Tax=Larinioides sclopetarius TaxID=280406 RepID=A0AAV1ZVB5_9ARAC